MSRPRIAVLIDGGHLRVLVKKAGITYNPDYIEKVAHQCVNSDKELLRVLYYDCAPYAGDVTLPVSGGTKTFTGNDHWMRDLAARDYFAVRRGVLKFRGWEPHRVPVSPTTLSDTDFKPAFEQKGVDMRIGLDVATYAVTKAAERIALLSGDTDCIPAMKQARIAGLQVVLIGLPNRRSSQEMLCHADFERRIPWPAP